MGELILAAVDRPRKLSVTLLDELDEEDRTMNKYARKKKEVEERTIKNETFVDVPAGKRVRIVMVEDTDPDRGT